MATKTNKQKFNATLRKYRYELKLMEAECDNDPDIQDDTEWVNEYYSLKGFIEGLEFSRRFVK